MIYGRFTPTAMRAIREAKKRLYTYEIVLFPSEKFWIEKNNAQRIRYVCTSVLNSEHDATVHIRRTVCTQA